MHKKVKWVVVFNFVPNRIFCKKYLITIFLLQLTFFYSKAQFGDKIFETLSTLDGLSQSMVYSIIRDNEGFMWIATADGLNKYDGYKFEIFQHNPYSKNSLNSNIIRDLKQCKDSLIWIAHYNEGLNLLNKYTGDMLSYKHDPDDSASISNDYVNVIFEDSRGNVWVGTKTGLNRFSKSTNNFKRFYHLENNSNSIPDNNIQSIIEDSRGKIWIGTWNGLSEYDPLQNSFINYFQDDIPGYSLTDNTILSLFEDHSGVLWIGTRNGGLNYKLPDGSGFFTPAIKKTEKEEGLKTILSISEDDDHKLYFGTWGGGLGMLSAGRTEFTVYRHQSKNSKSLSHNQVWDVYFDGNGILWLGTHGGGIAKLDTKRPSFDHYYYDSDDPGSLSNNMIISLFEDSKQNIWVGTYSGGLNVYGYGSKKFKKYFRDEYGRNSISSNRVGPVCEDSKGNIWIGTQLTDDHGGLNMFDPKTERFTWYLHEEANENSLASDDIWVLHIDKSENLWIGTSENGLDKFDINRREFKHFVHDPDDKNSICNNQIMCIAEDADQNLWIGTRGGLTFFDTKKNVFKSYFFDSENRNSLSDNFINCLLIKNHDSIWIGTKTGLNLFIPALDTFIHFFEKDGLVSNHIKAMQADSLGYLWISSMKGLTRFNTAERVFTSFTMSDGLQSKEFNDNTSFYGKSGRMYFGGVNGFNIIYPANVNLNSNPPKLLFTRLKLNNQEVNIAELSDNASHISQVRNLKLHYPVRSLQFEFVALSYTDPQLNQYQYKLEGFDDQWSEISKSQNAIFTNISPGTYKLIVRASNNHNIWIDEPLLMQFDVLPPFWLTKGFQIFAFCFIVGFAFLIHFLRVKNISARKIFLEREVANRTKQIFKQKEELEAQNYTLKSQKVTLQKQAEEIQVQTLRIEQINSFLKEKNLRLENDIMDVSKARILQKRVTFQEFKQIYPDNEACLKYLDELKWQDGFFCRKCGYDQYRYTNLKENNISYSRRCKSCKSIESPTVNTIFYRIKFPLVKAFYILFLVSGGKEYTIDELSNVLDLRPQTCWKFRNKVKETIQNNKGSRNNLDGWSDLILSPDKAIKTRFFLKKR